MMPNISSLTDSLKEEYNHLFALATLRSERRFAIQQVVRKITEPANMDRYRRVSAATGVPAHVIGIIHSLESSCNFNKHLHNGDPLTARTVQVPAKRPPGPPAGGGTTYSWEESAIDALTLKKLEDWSDWSIAGIAFVLESYNGFGYRKFHPHVKSPYLWSFSTVYTAGKYVADGTWSDTAVSGQCGGMVVLKALMEAGVVTGEMPVAPVEAPPAAAAPAAPVLAPPAFPGLLKMGSRGPAVEMLQRRLLDLGMRELGAADQDFGQKTDWAVRLFQARAVDEAGDPLTIDGVVGRKTWIALFGAQSAPAEAPAARPVAGSMSAAALAIASGEIGVREVPPGSNRGPEVDQYLDSVSSSLRGQPWCMAFVYWCYGQAATQAGSVNPMPKSASVLRSWEMARDMTGPRIATAREVAGDPSLVVPGMIFYIDTGGRTGHTGFVADVVGSTLVTIEGNTNDDGSREGIGVFTRSKRRIDSINLGFILYG